ncbi:MAG: TonB family protein [Gammaproteobacteria bacterium]
MSLPNTAHRTPADRAPARELARARVPVSEGLALFSRDRTLLQTVLSVSAGHDVSTIASETALANHLAAGRAGVAVIDAAAATSPITDLTHRLATQFPDLVLVVAGDARDQGLLAAQITNGTVHRFLHKPVSEQRVRAFVDAAWRRHDQEHVGPPPAATVPIAGSATRLPVKPLLIGGIAAVLLASGVGVWLGFFRDAADGPGASASVSTAKFRPAAAAPIEPDVDSAQLEQLLAEGEQALVAERIADAERLAADARALRPDDVRVAFLTAQIGKERERALLTRARQAAASGDVEAAIGVLEGAAGTGSSTLVAETRRELEQRKVEEQVAALLRRAEERASAGALIEPAQNNARFFIQSAHTLAPDAEAVRAAQRSFAQRLLQSSRASLAANDLPAGEQWLDAADEAGADRASVGQLRRELQRARGAARSATLSRLAANFTRRLGEDRLLEPADDSAKYWLGQLAAIDADHSSTKAARQSFANGVLAEGLAAVARADYAAADAWLLEARAAGAPEADAVALEKEITGARRASAVVDESALQRLRYVAPRYPDDARERESNGSVQLEFTVRADGSVGNVAVVKSEPAGVFDAAAVNAVRKWRYRPVVHDGAPAEQRARVRIRFTLE